MFNKEILSQGSKFLGDGTSLTSHRIDGSFVGFFLEGFLL